MSDVAFHAQAIRSALDDEGYFELPRALPDELIARAAADVERAVARGAPATAAFLADAMWEILDAVVPVARAALDAEIAILPAFWAWKVVPGETGWPPHRDTPHRAFTDDDRLAAVTIWVALSDATPRNGCMHVVPAGWDYEYRNPSSHNDISQPQHLRAIPAPAGTVLGWTHALLHWGGACAAGAAPRLSTSFELVRADLGDGRRTYPAGWRPTLAERVAIVDDMLAAYAHMHVTTDDERAAIAAIAGEAVR